MTACFAFDNTYARLPDRFFDRQDPVPVADPSLVRVNTALAGLLGVDAAWLAAPEGVAVLAGNRVPAGAEPMALAYAGHQFGGFSPILGDGRAILLGEVVGSDGRRRDIQLKGSGRTRFSRGADGRAALGPVLREYIVSEAMAALGVPTTRALAAVRTGETVLRESMPPGAVLTRVAASHVRIGTFQYFAARGDTEGVRILADYVIGRHDPDARRAELPYVALLEAIVARQARLMADWLRLGFVHGVMNTDNAAVSGETIDYGPCAFMEAYDPATVFSSIDAYGRYAYANQPRIARWNLARLAEALLPLLDPEQDRAVAAAEAALAGFAPVFEDAYLTAMRRKLGLAAARAEDAALITDLLADMQARGTDFTLGFRTLCAAAEGAAADVDPAWLARWWRRLDEEAPMPGRVAAMRGANPVYIPRNHLVAEALDGAESGRFDAFERLLAVVTAPFEERAGLERYALPATEEQRVTRTFCGT